ncbi:hypothetical protein BGZ75_003142, partial [Mortierella antarctica]
AHMSTSPLQSVHGKTVTTFCARSRTEQDTVRGARCILIATQLDLRILRGSARLISWMAVVLQSTSRKRISRQSSEMGREQGARGLEWMWMCRRRRGQSRSGASS